MITRRQFVKKALDSYPSAVELILEDESVEAFLERSEKENVGDTLLVFLARELSEVLVCDDKPMTVEDFATTTRCLRMAIKDLTVVLQVAQYLETEHG